MSAGDRDTLTDEERALMNCDCAEPYNWPDHSDSCFVPVVESIVAARVRAAQAQAWDEGRQHQATTMHVCASAPTHGGKPCNPYRLGDTEQP